MASMDSSIRISIIGIYALRFSLLIAFLTVAEISFLFAAAQDNRNNGIYQYLFIFSPINALLIINHSIINLPLIALMYDFIALNCY